MLTNVCRTHHSHYLKSPHRSLHIFLTFLCIYQFLIEDMKAKLIEKQM